MMDEPAARQARARWSQPPVRGLAGWSYGKGLLCMSPTAASSSLRSGTSSAGGGPQYSSSLPRGSHLNTLGASSTTAPTASDARPSTTVLPRRSPHVGMFAHAPPTRGFKDIIFEPYGFSMGRPALTQMDLARQERFRARHVEPAELQQLPASLYHECRREQRERRRRNRIAAATAAMSKSLGALDSLELEVDASSQFAWSYALVPPATATAVVEAGEGQEGEEEEEEQPWQFPMQGVGDEEGAARPVGPCADAGNHWEESEDGGSEDSDEDSGPPVCVICLEAFEASDVVRELPDCGHVHHKRCIDLWLRGVCSFEACYTRSCPTCKTPISFTPNPANTISTTDAPSTTSAAPGLVARIFEIPRSAYARVGSLLLQGGGEGAAAATINQGGV